MLKKSSKRNGGGFTLAEVLTVVAIIAVLLAVAIPNVIAYRRTLKLTELDDNARSVFMAAQSRLTALTSQGVNLSEIGAPAKATNCKYVFHTDSGSGDAVNDLHEVVLAGSIDPELQGDKYVVEFDPKSGAVYAVWYWEKDNNKFTYTTDAYNADAADPTNPTDWSKQRKAKMVGYYGGEGIDRPDIGQTPIPSAQVINAEELLLTITVPQQSLTSATIKADVTLSDGVTSVQIISGAKLKHVGSSYTGRVVLDTLKEASDFHGNASTNDFGVGDMGKPFKEWGDTDPTKSGKITPGKDFDIEVKVYVDGYLPQYVYCKNVNSLFESVDAAGTANIAFGRHLQNLDNDEYGITKAVQTRDIDFKATSAVTGEDPIYYWEDTYGYDTLKFSPINTSTLTEYDGGTYEIRFLNVGKPSDTSGDYLGLFGFLYNDITFKDIILVNTMVEESSGVGALAGFMANGSLDNCHVYLDEFNAAGSGLADKGARLTGTCVGGLVGMVSSSLELNNCSASTVISSTNYAGGLVGGVNEDYTIENSYAACNITGAYVGGLVGFSDASKIVIRNSYAAGTADIATAVIGNATAASGFFNSSASATDITVDNAYAAVRYGENVIKEAINVNGAYSGAGTGGSVYYVEQSGVNYAPNSGEGKTAGDLQTLFVGWGTGTSDNTHAYKLLTETSGLGNYPYPMLMTSSTPAEVMPHYGDWLEENAASPSSFCYYDVVGGDYGVWGYIADSAGNTTPVNTLQPVDLNDSDLEYATDDGYCVMVEQGGSAPANVMVDTTDSYSVEHDPVKDAGGTAVKVTHGGTDYNLYKINGLVAKKGTGSGIDVTDYYHNIKVGSTDYWFNPFFACEIQTSAPGDVDVPQAKEVGGTSYNEKDVIIRTARQLVWLGELTQGNMDSSNHYKDNPYFTGSDPETANFYLSYAYNQLLDIDYTEYKGDYDGAFTGNNTAGTLQTPINLLKGSPNGSYDGNKCVIRNLNIITDCDRTGLFGRVKGTVTEVTLVNAKVTSTANEASVGGLIGETIGGNTNPPTVTDCGIYIDGNNYDTYTIEATQSDSNAGGLIGNLGNHTEVNNCFAAVKVKGAASAGGLVGITKQEVTFENCYSGGHTEHGSYSTSNANVTAISVAGGFVGKLGKNNTFIGVCYSTCSVSGSNVGQLIGKTDTSSAPTTTGATLYAVGTTSGTHNTWEDTNLTTPAANLADILAATNGMAGATADKYDSTLGASYPYLTAAGAEHHGDWPELQEAVFYWEQEGTGADTGIATTGSSHEGYHFYVTGFLNGRQVTLNTLCTDPSHSMANDGYGLYNLTATGADMVAPTAGGALFDDLFGVKPDDVKTFKNDSANTFFSITSNVDSAKHYEFDVRYGNVPELLDTGSTTNWGKSVSNPYEIRTARQLDNIEGTDWTTPNTFHFRQTHEINGKGYTYSSNSYFAGTYDGGSHVIRNLEISDGGLFSSLEIDGTTVRNVILYSTENTEISGTDVGGIAGTVNAASGATVTITYCAVAGYNMSGTNVGGLVGQVSGGTLKIEKCEAVNTLAGTTGTTSYVGGLVGQVSDGMLTVNNSYAGGEITGSAASVGGLLGYLTAGSAHYNYDYSYMDMTEAGASSCYAIGGTGNIASWFDCFYLDNKFPTGQGRTEPPGANGLNAKSTSYQLGQSMIRFDGFSTPGSITGYKYDGSTGTYPFSAVVKEVNGYDVNGEPTYGNYVHYGNWE